MFKMIGFFIIFADQNDGSLDAVEKIFLIQSHFCGIITGKHLIYFEIFALDQAGNNDRIIKFEENMVRIRRRSGPLFRCLRSEFY